MPRLLDSAPGLLLVRVPRIAVDEVGERHRERPVLQLPDMAELVRQEVVARLLHRLLEQDQPPGRIAVEAAEPRKPEERRDDEDADALDADRLRVEVEPVEPGLRPAKRRA